MPDTLWVSGFKLAKPEVFSCFILAGFNNALLFIFLYRIAISLQICCLVRSMNLPFFCIPAWPAAFPYTLWDCLYRFLFFCYFHKTTMPFCFLLLCIFYRKVIQSKTGILWHSGFIFIYWYSRLLNFCERMVAYNDISG